MNSRRAPWAWRCLVPVALIVVAGCSSYKADQDPQLILDDTSDGIDANEVVAADGSIETRLVPLFDKDRAKSYLGIDPAKSRVMPALVRVVNTGTEPIKVDLPNSYLVIDPNERWSSLPLSEAIHRGLRSDAEVVGWMIAFGFPAWYAAAGNSANVNRTLEQDYHAKHFKPTLINAGASGHGIVFFDVPETSPCRVSSGVIRIHKLTTDAYTDVRLIIGKDVLIRQK